LTDKPVMLTCVERALVQVCAWLASKDITVLVTDYDQPRNFYRLYLGGPGLEREVLPNAPVDCLSGRLSDELNDALENSSHAD
jgi:hypothetical protein